MYAYVTRVVIIEGHKLSPNFWSLANTYFFHTHLYLKESLCFIYTTHLALLNIICFYAFAKFALPLSSIFIAFDHSSNVEREFIILNSFVIKY
jgi:hypothetical protein